MFIEQTFVEPFFPSIATLIAKLKTPKLTPEQVAEQRFLDSGAVFFSEGEEGEPIRIEPVPNTRIDISETYQVGTEQVTVESLLKTHSYDGGAYLINGVMVYVACDFDPYGGSKGKGTLNIDLSSTLTGYVARSGGEFVQFTYDLLKDDNTGERRLLTPKDAAVIYCFLKTKASKSSLKNGRYKIKPLYPVVDLDTPDKFAPKGEAKQPRPH